LSSAAAGATRPPRVGADACHLAPHSSERVGARARPLLRPLPRPVQCDRPSGILAKPRSRHRAPGSRLPPRAPHVDPDMLLEPVCAHTASEVVV
jgi:hypothetical protein